MNSNTTSPDTPLTDEELDELDDFLLEQAELESPMDISMLDGFVTAVVCSPVTIMPDEWLSWVWDTEKGEALPRFKDMAHANHIVDLIARMMNDIPATIEQAPDEYLPMLIEDPNDGNPVIILDDWCMGFTKGVGLKSAGWASVRAARPDLFATIERYGAWDDEDVRSESDPEKHRALAEALPGQIREIYALCAAERAASGQRQSPVYVRHEPVRNPDKVGRNDPCPCGSGKKYKRCHGSGDNAG